MPIQPHRQAGGRGCRQRDASDTDHEQDELNVYVWSAEEEEDRNDRGGTEESSPGPDQRDARCCRERQRGQREGQASTQEAPAS